MEEVSLNKFHKTDEFYSMSVSYFKCVISFEVQKKLLEYMFVDQVLVPGCVSFVHVEIICDGLMLRASKYLWNSSVFNEYIIRFIQSKVSVNTGRVYDIISLKCMSLKTRKNHGFYTFNL